jgi:hypothetical protein
VSYQPYKEGGRNSQEKQALILVLQTKFQGRMLVEFGIKWVGMDATHSVNNKNYPPWW